MSELLLQNRVFVAEPTPYGFAIGRSVLDEVELLTLAVDPEHQRQGIGRETLADFETQAINQGAATAFLEVAETNISARKLYAAVGWSETGRRKSYYHDGSERIDAILMSKSLSRV